jgi:hypothetical protein
VIRSPCGRAVDVFISYAVEDEPLRKDLETHLAPLRRDDIIRIWHTD